MSSRRDYSQNSGLKLRVDPLSLKEKYLSKFSQIVNNCREKSNDLKLRRCNPEQKILTDEFHNYYNDSHLTFTDFNRKPFSSERGKDYDNKMNYYQTQCNSYYDKFKNIIVSDCKNKLTVKMMLIAATVLIGITFIVSGFILKNKTMKTIFTILGSLILGVLAIIVIYNLFFSRGKAEFVESNEIPYL